MLFLAVCLVGAGVSFAADVYTGTWKLNEAKSKLSPNTAKNSTVVYEDAGDSVKVTIDGTDAAGKPTHNEWTGKFDGKDYPVTGDPASDTRALKTITDHKLSFTVKKGDKVTQSGTIVVSPDGKTRTLTASGTSANGNKFSITAIYDKQ